MSEEGLRVDQREGVAIWTLDRPARRNSLTRGLLLALGRVAREVAENRSIRAVVLTGAGDQAFCAGADLKERAEMTEDAIRKQLRLYRTELGAIENCPKPVVAAINGVAFGGGLELAMACDLRVACPDVLLALPETTLGIIPGAGGTQRLPRIVGEGRAKELILRGGKIGADQALAWGLINRITPDGADLLTDTLSWMEPIVRGAPLAQAAALRAIDYALSVPLTTGMAMEQLCYEETLSSEDRREALRAFAEKRSPNFQGK